MWQLEIYPSLMEGAYIEQYKRSGSLADWLKEAGIEWEARDYQPIVVTVDGEQYPVEDWHNRITSGSIVKVRVVPFGSIGKLIGKILNFVMKIFGGKPKTQSRADTPQSKSLESVEATGNSPKLGEVVPEILGVFRKYPDYLVQPRRYFLDSDPRTQVLEFHACIGPGEYTIDARDVKIGNTSLNKLEGKAEYTIYQPNQSLVGVSTNENWYHSPEVGATSSGSNGIDLNSEVLDTVNIAPTSYTFASGNVLSRSNGVWPVGWELNTILQITTKSSYAVQHELVDAFNGSTKYTVITGNFKHLAFLQGSTEADLRARVGWLEITFNLTSGNLIGGQTFRPDGPISLTGVNIITGVGTLRLRGYYGVHNTNVLLSFFDVFGGFRITELTSSTSLKFSRVYTPVTPDRSPSRDYAQFVNTSNFLGFSNGTSVAGSASFITGPAFGVRSVNFSATPAGEMTNLIELDFFFASGLCKVEDSGALSSRTVQIEVDITDADSGQTFSIPYTFTQSTVDQIGFSKRIQLGPIPSNSSIGLFGRAIRPLVAMRRVTAASTSTSVNDKITWQSLKSFLPNVSSYPNWTTIGIKMRSGGKVSSDSETQINVIAQRMIEPVVGGTKRVSSHIEDYVRYIALTAGYSDASLDTVELTRLGNIWSTRGDYINHIFDETTVEQAISTTLAIGFADLTIDNGRIKPVRDEPRTVFEHAYSAQNMLQGGLERQFKTPRPDDIDGVEVDYMDSATWTRKTVVCTLPGSLRIRLKKVKVDGVTDRTRAWRHGMRQLLVAKYRTWSYSFSTELDAMCSTYLSYVPIFDEIPKYSQTALVLGVETNTPVPGMLRVTLTEDIKWGDYTSSTVVIAFRDTSGVCSGFFSAVQGDSPNVVEVQTIVPGPYPSFLTNTRTINEGEPIHAFIGVSNKISLPSLVTEISPNGYNQVNVKAVNYDARVYENDDKEPPLGA